MSNFLKALLALLLSRIKAWAAGLGVAGGAALIPFLVSAGLSAELATAIAAAIGALIVERLPNVE